MRMFLLVVAILVVAGFAALNWPEFSRPAPLDFGGTIMEVPLGFVMLGVLAVTILGFLIAGAMQRNRALVESRQSSRALERQRELAEKAEASRFTDLRQHFETQIRELRQHDAIAATELEKAGVQSQRELRNQLDQMSRMLSARLSELESRIDSRLSALAPLPPGVPARDTSLRPDLTRSEHATAETTREERLRDEERVRAEAERARPRL